MFIRFRFAKVRISENNTKQKSHFLFLLSNESTFDEVKGTNKYAKKQINLDFSERDEKIVQTYIKIERNSCCELN